MAECEAKLDVSTLVYLVCDLAPGHSGLHHDQTDGVRWISDADYDDA